MGGYEMRDGDKIQVRPEFLTQKSCEMAELCGRLAQAYAEIGALAQGTKECFAGRSGERFRRRIEKRRQEGEELSGELRKLSERLREIAGEYALAEKENRNVIGGN